MKSTAYGNGFQGALARQTGLVTPWAPLAAGHFDFQRGAPAEGRPYACLSNHRD